MSVTFRQAYAKLTDFAAKHPEIEIGDSVTSIPENVRPDFYGLFNAARDAFVFEKFPSHLARASELQERYDSEVKDASAWSSLEDPPSVNPVRRFLCNPRDSMIRELFDPVFDLLKGRGSIDDIEKTAAPEIEKHFATSFRGGYEKWAVLGLLNLLEIESAFRVSVRNLNTGERSKPAAQAPLEEVPAPQESTSFFFSQPQNAIFAVPDFIVYSSRLHRFVGIRSEFRESAYNALNASHDREWIGIDADLRMLLSTGLTLIYVSEQVENLSLVADVVKFCRPDLILWCIDTLSMNQTDVLATIRQAHKSLKPSRGIYIVANDDWTESFESLGNDAPIQPGEESAEIHWLKVGYERAKLLPVAEALIDSIGPTETT